MEWSEPAYGAMANAVSAAIGIAFPEVRRSATEQAMAAVWRRAGVGSARAYLADLLAGTTALDALIDELVIGETYFFRDAGQFTLLEREILPALRGRGGRGLAIWSAGCASGEEAYSLAVAAAASTPDGAIDHVLGTDISTRALATARAASYGAWSLRGVPADTIDRVFTRRDKIHVVRDHWRRHVEFARGNLTDDAARGLPAPGLPVNGTIDLILCRNVLIYFDDAAIRRAAAALHAALRDGGYLVTSPSDPPLWELAPLTAVTTRAGIVYRRDDASARPAPASRITEFAALPMQAALPAPAAPAPAAPAAAAPAAASTAAASTVPASAAPTAVDRAARAFAAGAWLEAARLTAAMADLAAALLHVRAVANARGTADAERACATAAARHATSAALHHLHALLLLALDRLADAAAAARRALFLDPGLAIGHFVLATIASRAGDLGVARRSYRNVRDLLRDAPDDAPVPEAEDQRAGALRSAAEAALADLDPGAPRAGAVATARATR